MEHIPGARHWAYNSEPEGCPRTHRPPFPRPRPRRGIPLQRLGAREGGGRTRPPYPRPRPQINENHLAGEPHAPPPPPGPRIVPVSICV